MLIVIILKEFPVQIRVGLYSNNQTLAFHHPPPKPDSVLLGSGFFISNFFKVCCMPCCMLHEKIVAFLKNNGGPCTQRDIALGLPNVNRAVLLGYLRALSDLGKIKSRDSGKAKVYYL